jgi:PAS domain S-box-containing protein
MNHHIPFFSRNRSPLLIILPIVLLGFGMILIAQAHFNEQSNSLEKQIHNETNQSIIGTLIVSDLQKLQGIFLKAIPANNLYQSEIRLEYSKVVADIISMLDVIESGGEISRITPLDIPGQEIMNRTVSYQPLDKQRYIMPIIELRPQLSLLDQKFKQLQKITHKPHKTLDKRNKNHHLPLLHHFTMTMEPYFATMIEKANQLLYDSQQQVEYLEQILEPAKKYQRQQLFTISGIIVFIVLFLVWFVSKEFNTLQITLQKQLTKLEATEQARAIANKRFYQILNGFEAIIFVADPITRKALFVNQFAREKQNLQIGDQCCCLFDNENKSSCSCYQFVETNFTEKQSETNKTWECNASDGCLEVHGQRIDWEDDKHALLVMALDVSERKKAQEERNTFESLLKEQQRQQLLQTSTELSFASFAIESNSFPIIWIKHDSQLSDNQFVHANRAACDTLGYNLEELHNLQFSDFITRINEDLLSKLWQTLRIKKSLSLYIQLRHKDGHTFPADLHFSYFVFEDIEYQFVFFQDISEQKTMQQQLRQSQKMEAIGTLAGGIAHDFNNILTAILGYTQLAKMQARESNLEYLEQVILASNRAKDLVGQILTFSRKNTVKKSSLRVSLVVKEAMKLLRASLPTTIEIKENINSSEKVLADPVQIHQVIMNLATNAFQAMDNNRGVLEVTLEDNILARTELTGDEQEAGYHIHLRVHDTGRGIPGNQLKSIFDPYFTTREREAGTGLGLAVVHGIVSDHGGYITVESVQGQGTQFDIYLPQEQKRNLIGIGQHHANEAIDEIKGGSERILIIDDELVIVTMLAQTLTNYGYIIDSFTDPLAAWQTFRNNPKDYDLILTDMTMPGMTGEELVGKIVHLRPNIPIILCSGYSYSLDQDSVRAIGIHQFIPKPINITTLAATVRKLLDAAKNNHTRS